MLVALHGFTGGGGDFAPLAEALSAWRWQMPNLPGHAPDSLNPLTPSDDCTLAASLRYIDSLIPENPADLPILLGYSLGGRLALRYALARPGRLAALILISTSPGIINEVDRKQRGDEDELLAKKLLVHGVPEFLNEWQRRPLIASQARLPEAWRAAMNEQRRKLRATGLAASLRGFGQGAVEPVWGRLGELQLPTLVCAGAEDKKYAVLAKEIVADCPRAELLIVPAAGHMAHLENLPAFTTGLQAFLTKHRLSPQFK